jgi:hypothetical protein
MKLSILLLCLLPLIASSQIQVGQDIDGRNTDDNFGNSVSISSNGKRLAIGIPLSDENGFNSGQAKIFEEVNGTWSQVGQDINGEAIGDNFGSSVALSSDGTVIAVGAPSNDENGSNAGQVRIFEEVNGNWFQIGQDINGEAVDDNSGSSISLSAEGIRVAIGARNNDGNGSSSGHTRVLSFIEGGWVQIGEDINGEVALDQSGSSVSLSSDGTRVAIGARNNSENGPNSGHVRIYEEINGIWGQVGLDIDGESTGDNSGVSTSLSSDGNRIAIGSPLNDSNGSSSGHVRVYEDISGVWKQVGANINGEASGDQSGFSLSLSSDGAKIAIGAYLNEGTGIGSGHVRIYELINDNWIQIVLDIDGEAVNDHSGFALSLSSDGIRVAIGAPSNDGNSIQSGHSRVYELNQSLPVIVLAFTGFRNKNSISLEWQIVPEANRLFFDLEHLSKEGNWSSLHRLVSTETNITQYNYSFQHDSPHFGQNYYRLRITEIDGNSSYSSIVKIDNSQINVSIYPNPVANRLNVNVPDEFHPYKVNLYSVEGKFIKSFPLNAEIIYLYNIPSSRYLIEIAHDIYYVRKWLIVK